MRTRRAPGRAKRTRSAVGQAAGTTSAGGQLLAAARSSRVLAGEAGAWRGGGVEGRRRGCGGGTHQSWWASQGRRLEEVVEAVVVGVAG